MAPSWRLYWRCSLCLPIDATNQPLMQNTTILVLTEDCRAGPAPRRNARLYGPGGAQSDSREFPVLAKQFPFWPQKIPGFPTINLT